MTTNKLDKLIKIMEMMGDYIEDHLDSNYMKINFAALKEEIEVLKTRLNISERELMKYQVEEGKNELMKGQQSEFDFEFKKPVVPTVKIGQKPGHYSSTGCWWKV